MCSSCSILVAGECAPHRFDTTAVKKFSRYCKSRAAAHSISPVSLFKKQKKKVALNLHSTSSCVLCTLTIALVQVFSRDLHKSLCFVKVVQK